MSIKTIRQFTEDALANQFNMIIPPFPGSQDIQQTNLRVISLDVPEYTIGTYSFYKKGTQITRRSGLSETPTEFSFTYRIDKNYSVYQGFIAWMRLCRDSVTGVMAPENAIRVPITAYPIDSNDNILSTGWQFFGCFPSSHDGVSFDEESGDPLTASVTMQMLGFDPATV